MTVQRGLSKALWLVWNLILKLFSTVSDISTDKDKPTFSPRAQRDTCQFGWQRMKRESSSVLN